MHSCGRYTAAICNVIFIKQLGATLSGYAYIMLHNDTALWFPQQYNCSGYQQSQYAALMHHFTELKMQSSLVLCLAVALCCYLLCTQALPIAVEEGRSQVENGLVTADNQFNDHVKTVSRRLLEMGCNSSYNGHKISPHLCKMATIKTFAALKLGLLQ